MLGLILAGFALVVLPLMWAVYRGSAYVDQLAAQSESLVLHAVQVTRESKQLAEHITAMERNARQYAVLGEADLLALYEEAHTRFASALTALAALDGDGTMRGRLARMRAEGEALLADVKRSVPGSEGDGVDVDAYARLGESAEAIARENARSIDEQVASLQATASQARRTLFWQSAALFPVTGLLAGLFTILIARPIRQIGRAIHGLGEGSLTRPVKVSGPAELRALGDELNWLRGRLAELEQEKNAFLRQMSHELKTPLASVREGTELLGDGTVGRLGKMQSEVVEILRDSAHELEQRIENLLSFSAWEQSKARLTLGEFALSELVDRIIDNHRLGIVNKRLKVAKKVCEVRLLADREKVRMAIENLVSNAVKYSPEAGRLGIRAVTRDGAVVVDVIDEGPGIPEEERDRIFDPFFQGVAPSSRHVRGTGIGLSVVRECVQAHGGEIKVRVRRSGGAHFRIKLPLNHDAKAA